MLLISFTHLRVKPARVWLEASGRRAEAKDARPPEVRLQRPRGRIQRAPGRLTARFPFALVKTGKRGGSVQRLPGNGGPSQNDADAAHVLLCHCLDFNIVLIMQICSPIKYDYIKYIHSLLITYRGQFIKIDTILIMKINKKYGTLLPHPSSDLPFQMGLRAMEEGFEPGTWPRVSVPDSTARHAEGHGRP